jgi:hypothetical protein
MIKKNYEGPIRSEKPCRVPYEVESVKNTATDRIRINLESWIRIRNTVKSWIRMLIRKSKFKSFRSSKWSPEGTVDKWPQIRITILRIRIRIRIDVKSRTVIRIQEKSSIRIRNLLKECKQCSEG